MDKTLLQASPFIHPECHHSIDIDLWINGMLCMEMNGWYFCNKIVKVSEMCHLFLLNLWIDTCEYGHDWNILSSSHLKFNQNDATTTTISHGTSIVFDVTKRMKKDIVSDSINNSMNHRTRILSIDDFALRWNSCHRYITKLLLLLLEMFWLLGRAHSPNQTAKFR